MADKEYSLIEEIDSEACDTLLNRVDGEECFNIMFPPSDDDFKSELDKRNGCWTVTKKYLLKMRDNGYRCDIQYNHSERNPTSGRLFGHGSVQSLKGSVRKYLTSTVYRDWDMCNAHPNIMVCVCFENNLECPHLIAYCKHRAQFLADNGVTKKQILTLFNQDQPRLSVFNKNVQNLLSELQQNKEIIYTKIKTIYNVRNDANNPLSACINALWCDWENRILQEAIRCVDLNNEGVLMFDGFMCKKEKQIDVAKLSYEYKAQTSGKTWTLYWAEKENHYELPALAEVDQYLKRKKENRGYNISRDFYEHAVDGIHRTKPFELIRSTTEGSDMGSGKSHMLAAYIEEHFANSDQRVLLIYHRRTLIEHGYETYWKGLGFGKYDVKGVKRMPKKVYCIDSLWQIEEDDLGFDLVAIDETPQVIRQMCALKIKTDGSGKWNVWRRLREILQYAKHTIFLSAQSDTLVEMLQTECKITSCWRQNKYSLLADYQYEFAHFEGGKKGFSMAYRRVFEELERKKRLVMPFAEQKVLEAFETYLKENHNYKILSIHGQMSDDEKRLNLERWHDGEEEFDLVLHTASVDCGVSINHEGYDLVMFVLGARSIDPEAALQMCHRVRNLKEKKIVFLCDARVKDWERWPGYKHENTKSKELTEFAKRNYKVIEASSIADVNRQLLRDECTEDVVYYQSNKTKTWYRFEQRVPPMEETLEETETNLLRTANYHAYISQADRVHGEHRTKTIGELIHDCDVIKCTVKYEDPENMGLVRLIIYTLNERMNQPRNFLTNLRRMIERSGCTNITNTFTIYDDGDVDNISKKDVEKERARAVLEAEDAPMELLQEIQIKRNKKECEVSAKETTSLNKAFVVATFGNDVISTAQEDDYVSIADVNKQKMFREQCRMQEPENGYMTQLLKTLPPMERMEDAIDTKSHKSNIQQALVEILYAYGYTLPLDYTKRIEFTPEKEKLLRKAVEAYNRLRPGKLVQSVKDPRKAASAILRQQLGVWPSQVGHSEVLQLKRHDYANVWGLPTWERYCSYKQFEDELFLRDQYMVMVSHNSREWVAGGRVMETKREALDEYNSEEHATCEPHGVVKLLYGGRVVLQRSTAPLVKAGPVQNPNRKVCVNTSELKPTAQDIDNLSMDARSNIVQFIHDVCDWEAYEQKVRQGRRGGFDDACEEMLTDDNKIINNFLLARFFYKVSNRGDSNHRTRLKKLIALRKSDDIINLNTQRRQELTTVNELFQTSTQPRQPRAPQPPSKRQLERQAKFAAHDQIKRSCFNQFG